MLDLYVEIFENSIAVFEVNLPHFVVGTFCRSFASSSSKS